MIPKIKKQYLALPLALMTLPSVSSAAVLAYEGFDSSGSGSGDAYLHDASIRNTTDARIGFTGAWNDPPTAAGIDYEVRSTNMAFTNLQSGDLGALEIYEARSGKSPTARGISRSLDYTMSDSDDTYFAFGWATADAVAHGITLTGTRTLSLSVTSAGTTNVNFDGGSATNYSGGSAHMDGTWNLLVIRAINDPVSASSAYYDSYELWLNPNITSGNGNVSQLGTPDGTGDGIIREQNGGGTPVAFTGVNFSATVGTGHEVQFDEFRITDNPADFLVTTVPEPSSLALLGLGGLGLLIRRRC